MIVDTLKELIERLEKAPGSDRELDAAIWWLVERPAATRRYHNAALGAPRDLPVEWSKVGRGLGTAAVLHFAQRYTSSIDVALKLLPEKSRWYIQTYDDDMVEVVVWHGWMHNDFTNKSMWTEQSVAWRKTAPAVAMCIAALKARLVEAEDTARRQRLDAPQAP